MIHYLYTVVTRHLAEALEMIGKELKGFKPKMQTLYVLSASRGNHRPP